jgi:bidirectional [NiFe] hydrogenase diaphorase subunit
VTRVVTLTIDDRDVSGRDDETILDVARDNGVDIPTLCHLDGLTDVGACRLCVVEVRGHNRLMPACTTRVAEGMAIYTNTERLQRYRRTIVELLFSEGNHVCSVCVVNGHCDLQSLAQRLGINYIDFKFLTPKRKIDASHERFLYDGNRCVLCTRCVRVCDEVEGAHTWDVMARGIRSEVITDLDQPWGESPTCTSCGKCVQVCPTGALVAKGSAVGQMRKRREFLSYLKTMRGNHR